MSGSGLVHRRAGSAARALLLVLPLAPLLAGGLSPLPAAAAPAPWHLWASQHSDRRICTQTSPGPGWTRVAGPYRDARCQRAL